MKKMCAKVLMVVGLMCVLATSSAFAETLTREFTHQLLVNTPPQSWEHRIDLPDQAAFQGQVFQKRNLKLLGRLVIEAEELTPTYYYVKVRLPKHVAEPAKGIITIALEIGAPLAAAPVLGAPTQLEIMKGSASRKPIFTWKADGRFSAITVLDVTTGKTVWERIIVGYKGAEYDEGYLPIGHQYKWAVKQANEFGKYGTEAQAGFRIVQQGDSVIIIND
jgi:hypothetical protein